MNINFENDKTKNNKLRILCSNCANETKHIVLTSINESGSDMWEEYHEFFWNSDYEIIQCLGCETVSFRNIMTNSEHEDDYGRTIPTIILYPRRGKDTKPQKYFKNVPYNLTRIYRETIESYNYGNLTLCGAGVRALVEGICLDNGITSGNVEIKKNDETIQIKKKTTLEGKINGLHEKGKLTKQNAEILHEHRFLGNDAIHELSVPPKEDLELALEIVENVFDTLYEIPNKGLSLKKKRLEK